MTPPITTLGYEQDSLQTQAAQLAKQLNYTLDKNAPTCLFVTEQGLALKIPGFSLLYANFSFDFWRKKATEGKKQGIVRACKPEPGLKIIDATAGWGRDAAILASYSAEVLMLERQPLMYTLLNDALARRKEVDQEHMHLTLIQTDAYDYLNKLPAEDYPDVIYIDPMHPARHKSALVKKDLQALQHLIGPDEDALRLITLALTRAKKRVVVKWPQKTKPLLSTHNHIPGKTIRFDIYFPVI